MKRTVLLLLIISLCTLPFLSQSYRLKTRQQAPPRILALLDSLANKALEKQEVPVGAVLMYGDSILGTGYNNIVADTLLSGHAELNALNAAHKKYRPVWGQLDRTKMTMYSTYEPCEMCKGAMLNMHIDCVIFEGPKPAGDQLKTTLRSCLYDLKKRRFYAPDMQENLFRRHPKYRK